MRISDWSSDVCSSDLPQPPGARVARPPPARPRGLLFRRVQRHDRGTGTARSAARRPGKAVADVQERAREGAAAAFLRSFFTGEPDWTQLDLPIDPSRLPAVQWKLKNLGRLRAEQAVKFGDQLARDRKSKRLNS